MMHIQMIMGLMIKLNEKVILKSNTSEYTNWSENQSKSRINWKQHREFKMRVK